MPVTTTHQVIAGGDGIATTGSTTQTYANDLAAFIAYGHAQGVIFEPFSTVSRSRDVSVIPVPLSANDSYPDSLIHELAA